MPDKSLSSKIFKSSFWQYLGSWFDRIIGFLSTIILARILVPDDFGIVSAAAIITGLFHVISSVGTKQYLLRKSHITNSDLNTGWTINLIMKSLSGVGVFLSAGSVATFVGDERLILVLQVTSITPILSGFSNIGILLFEKEFNYKPGIILAITNRLFGFVIKIALAFYLQNYWAFIIAEILQTAFFIIGTFVIHPYRPRLSFVGWKEQWFFSQWVLLKSIFAYLRFKVDAIFMSKYLPIESLGVYTVAKDVAVMPSGQIIGPVMEPLYVALSSVHNNADLLADKIHKILSVIFIIVLPISLGTFVTAENMVYVLLGDKWSHATPIVMILAFVLLPATLNNFLTKVMTVMGKVKLIFQFELFLAAFTVISFALLVKNMDILDFAVLRVALSTINTLIVLAVLSYISSLSFVRIIGLMIIPTIMAIVMAFAISGLEQSINPYNPLIQLLLQILLGAVIYLSLASLFVYLLKNRVVEYHFVWKTFYLPLLKKVLR